MTDSGSPVPLPARIFRVWRPAQARCPAPQTPPAAWQSAEAQRGNASTQGPAMGGKSMNIQCRIHAAACLGHGRDQRVSTEAQLPACMQAVGACKVLWVQMLGGQVPREQLAMGRWHKMNPLQLPTAAKSLDQKQGALICMTSGVVREAHDQLECTRCIDVHACQWGRCP